MNNLNTTHFYAYCYPQETHCIRKYIISSTYRNALACELMTFLLCAIRAIAIHLIKCRRHNIGESNRTTSCQSLISVKICVGHCFIRWFCAISLLFPESVVNLLEVECWIIFLENIQNFFKPQSLQFGKIHFVAETL